MKKISDFSELDRRVAGLPTTVPEGQPAVWAQSLLCRKKIQNLLRVKAGLATDEKVCPEVVLRVMHDLGEDLYTLEDVAEFLNENMANGATTAGVEEIFKMLQAVGTTSNRK